MAQGRICRQPQGLGPFQVNCDSDVRGRNSVGVQKRAQFTRRIQEEWQRIGNATNECSKEPLLFVAFEFVALLISLSSESQLVSSTVALPEKH